MIDRVGTLEARAARLLDESKELRAALSSMMEPGQSVEGKRYRALLVAKKGYTMPARDVAPTSCLTVKRI